MVCKKKKKIKTTINKTTEPEIEGITKTTAAATTTITSTTQNEQTTTTALLATASSRLKLHKHSPLENERERGNER